MWDNEQVTQRDRDLVKAYKDALKTKTFNSQVEVTHYLETIDAPRFYLSGTSLCNLMIRIRKGKKVCDKPHIVARNKYLIYLFNALKQTDEYKNYSDRALCDVIVNFPAPRFYMSYDKIKDVIEKARR